MPLLLQVPAGGFAAPMPLKVVRARQRKEAKDAKAAQKRTCSAGGEQEEERCQQHQASSSDQEERGQKLKGGGIPSLGQGARHVS